MKLAMMLIRMRAAQLGISITNEQVKRLASHKAYRDLVVRMAHAIR